MSRGLKGLPITQFERPEGVAEFAPKLRLTQITDLKAAYNPDTGVVENCRGRRWNRKDTSVIGCIAGRSRSAGRIRGGVRETPGPRAQQRPRGKRSMVRKRYSNRG